MAHEGRLELEAVGAGPSGVTKTKRKVKAANLPGGEYERPAFVAARLSPGLNPRAGGSGSKSSHAMVLRESPARQPKFE